MPARNKNRLAPLTIKPPKLRKYAAQSRKKDGFAVKSLPLRHNILPHNPPETMQTPLDNS